MPHKQGFKCAFIYSYQTDILFYTFWLSHLFSSICWNRRIDARRLVEADRRVLKILCRKDPARPSRVFCGIWRQTRYLRERRRVSAAAASAAACCCSCTPQVQRTRSLAAICEYYTTLEPLFILRRPNAKSFACISTSYMQASHEKEAKEFFLLRLTSIYMYIFQKFRFTYALITN